MKDSLSILTTDDLWSQIVESHLTDRHLSLMNLNWWPNPPWEALTPYARIAGKVVDRSELIRPLIEDRNWRTNLFGVAIAVLADAKPLLDSMIARIGDSWVAPQIAAGVALLLPDPDNEGRDLYLSKLLEIAMAPPANDELKYLMSAYAALRICSKSHVKCFEENAGFGEKWRVGGAWYDLTKMHYERWRSMLPYLVRYANAR